MRVLIKTDKEFEITNTIDMYTDSIPISDDFIEDLIHVQCEGSKVRNVYSSSSNFQVLHYEMQQIEDQETLVLFVAQIKRNKLEAFDDCVADFIERTKLMSEIIQKL